jgi:hypothetical protein
MAVSRITPPAVNAAQAAGQFNSFRVNFQALVGAVRSGNLAGAQQAYAAVTKVQPSDLGLNDRNNPLTKVLNQIGNALQSNDLAAARQALASLQQQAQGPRRHHHYGGDGTGNGDASSDATNAPSSAPSSGGRSGGGGLSTAPNSTFSIIV